MTPTDSKVTFAIRSKIDQYDKYDKYDDYEETYINKKFGPIKSSSGKLSNNIYSSKHIRIKTTKK